MAVYFIHDAGTGLVKIGVSQNPWARLSQIQSGSASVVALVGIVDGDAEAERKMHARFADLRVRGEWFQHHGSLAAFIAGLPRPTRPLTARQAAPPSSPLEAWMRENAVNDAALAARVPGLSRSQINRIRNGRGTKMSTAAELSKLTGLPLIAFAPQAA